jgi:predicted hydrolase (HD superfamily)
MTSIIDLKMQITKPFVKELLISVNKPILPVSNDFCLCLSFHNQTFILMPHNLGRNSFGDPANAGNLMSVEEAHNLLNEWVPNEKLRLHMKQVAAVMKAWAIEKENADEQTALKWELAGLLHDADWEKYPDDHCRIIIEELEKRNIDPEVIHCIASHGPGYFGVEPNNTMDKMIYAFDELSGFVHAAALIRPTRYEGLEVKSVLKRLKSPAFAAQVSREDINDAISRINIPLEEIIQFVIDHQKDVN